MSLETTIKKLHSVFGEEVGNEIIEAVIECAKESYNIGFQDGYASAIDSDENDVDKPES